jgi:hypothetical protein
MRRLVHLFARLAITASFSTPAAALDMQALSPMSIPHLQSFGVRDVKFSIGDRRGQASQQAENGFARCGS